jgi:glucose-1-phosphate thymidylyltransferase
MAQAKAVILVGETRARGRWPLCRTPPQLVDVANKPLLVHQLEALMRSGIDEVAIVTRPSTRPAIREVLESQAKTELHIEYLTERPRSRGLQSLLAAESFAADSVLVIQWGALLLEHDLRQSMRLLVSRGLDLLAIGAPVDALRPAEVVSLSSGRPVLAVDDEGPRIADVDTLVLGPGLWDVIRELRVERKSSYSGVQLFSQLAEAGLRVGTEPVTHWRARIDGVEQLLDANRHLLDRVQGGYDQTQLTEVAVQQQVLIAPTARVETSVLRGPVVVGPGAYISDSYIGPYTSIGADVRLESVEMEHSVVMRGATIGQVGMRIEGSVIGAGARVMQDIGPPRALRAWVGEDADISLG